MSRQTSRPATPRAVQAEAAQKRLDHAREAVRNIQNQVDPGQSSWASHEPQNSTPSPSAAEC